MNLQPLVSNLHPGRALPHFLLLALGLTGLTTSATAQTLQNEDLLIYPADIARGDEFGIDVAIEGDRMVVGSHRSETSSNAAWNDGAAYVFDFDGTNWIETQRLVASDAAFQDEFGGRISLDGDRVAIAARNADGNLPSLIDSGVVYVFDFDGTTWNETQLLYASDVAAGANFGTDVVLVGDTLFISAQFADAPGSVLGDEGAVYVFDFDGTTWTETQILVASDAEPTELFGTSIDSDGTRLVVGGQHEGTAPLLTEAGAAYIFENNGTMWVETQKLIASDRDEDNHFGSAVAIEGDRIAVGAEERESSTGFLHAGAAYVFDHNGTMWVETTILEASDADDDDNNGFALDMQGDFIVTGARNESGVNVAEGAAYIWEFDGLGWSEIAKLKALQSAGPFDNQRFGRTCSIDGDRILIGSTAYKPNAGARAGGAFLFTTDLNAASMHALFSESVTSGQTPLNVDFTDLSLGGATTWAWDFGDGNSATTQDASHSYLSPGTFTVSLTATGSVGSDVETKAGLIVVTALPATAVVRNGLGINDLCFSSLTDPIIGTTWSSEVDTINHPGAGLTFVIGYDTAFTGLTTGIGEILIAVEGLGGNYAYMTTVNSLGGIAQHDAPIPLDLTNVGIFIATQAVILGGSGPELCNAIDVTMGY